MVMLFFGVVLVFVYLYHFRNSDLLLLPVFDGACPIVNSGKMEPIAAAKTNHPQKGDNHL